MLKPLPLQVVPSSFGSAVPRTGPATRQSRSAGGDPESLDLGKGAREQSRTCDGFNSWAAASKQRQGVTTRAAKGTPSQPGNGRSKQDPI